MARDLLSIIFEGEALEKRSLPIYELASTLISVQRIVHKAALFAEGKLEKGSHLPTERRKELALQVSSHQKGSDIWGLAPFLTDRALGPIFQGLIVIGIGALGAYAARKISSVKDSQKPQLLVVNIFPEVKQMTDRIGNIGGVDRIKLFLPSQAPMDAVTIDADTQEYVRELEYQLVSGKKMKICGVVTRLFPQSFRLDLEDAPGHYVRVRTSEEIFEKVRRLRSLAEREICFEGVPHYKLGETRAGLHEFEAQRVILSRSS